LFQKWLVECFVQTEIMSMNIKNDIYTIVGNEDGLGNGHGELTYMSGTHYVGEFKNNEFEGTGTLTFPGDFIYSGSFHCGLPHGYGVKVYYLTSRCYKGFFNQGKYEGKATLVEPNKYSFTGYLVADQRVCWSGGERTYRPLRGDSYISAPLDSQLTGFGSVAFEGGKWYCGGFLHGLFHGAGVLKLNNSIKRKMIGRFERGLLVGYYTVCFPKGFKSWAKNYPFEIYCENDNLPFLPGSYEDDGDLNVSCES
jgi:hypothetical protein